MEKIKLWCGFGAVDVSPKGPCMLAGQYYARLATEVKHPLYATALALCPEGKPEEVVFWVSADLIGFPRSIVKAVSAELAKNIPGFDESRFIGSAIHTHTAPYLSMTELNKSWEAKLEKPEGYVTSEMFRNETLIPGIAAACLTAMGDLKPGYVSPVLGNATIGHNRRIHYRDGSSIMFGNTDDYNFDCPEGPSDSRVEMMYFYGEDKELRGLFMNVPCPSQCFTRKEYVSSDYYGIFRGFMAEKLGRKLPIVTTIGAAGDMFPQDYYRRNRGEPEMRELEGAEELARRLVNCFEYNSERAAAGMTSEVEYAHKYMELMLPINTVSAKQVAAAKEVVAKLVEKCGGDISKLSQKDATQYGGNDTVIRNYERQNKSSLQAAPVHFLRIGESAFITNPFELFSVYGMRIVARTKAEHVFITQLTCDIQSYLPTPIAVAGGGYSAGGGVGPAGGEYLTESSILHINELFE